MLKENAAVDVPVDTTGLTQINPKDFTLTTVGQKLRWNNNDLGERDFDSVSELNAVGTFFGGSWYTQIDSNNLTNLSSWQLGELQYLRQTDTGILVRPFEDLNSNGKRDRGEKIHTEDAELLLIVNHKSLQSVRRDITNQGVFVRLAPGEYRLDLDPAGYPFNLKPTESSYAVWVTHLLLASV